MKVRSDDDPPHRAPPAGRATTPRRRGSAATRRRATRPSAADSSVTGTTSERASPPAPAKTSTTDSRAPAPARTHVRGKVAASGLAPVDDEHGPRHGHAGRHVDEHGVGGEGVVEAHQSVAAAPAPTRASDGPRARRRRARRRTGPAGSIPAGVAKAARRPSCTSTLPAVAPSAARSAASSSCPPRAGAGASGGRGLELVEGEVVDRRVAPDLLALGGERGRCEGLVARRPAGGGASPAPPGPRTPRR